VGEALLRVRGLPDTVGLDSAPGRPPGAREGRARLYRALRSTGRGVDVGTRAAATVGPASRRTAPSSARARGGAGSRREFEYVRRGRVDLLAGFWAGDGRVYGLVRAQHRSRDFCELLDLLDRASPPGQPIHLIPDPVSAHRSAEVARWLDARPERAFVLHVLPVHASWLWFLEVWFSILSRKCLKRADFPDFATAADQIEAFIATYNTHLAHPFAWKKGVRCSGNPREGWGQATAVGASSCGVSATS